MVLLFKFPEDFEFELYLLRSCFPCEILATNYKLDSSLPVEFLKQPSTNFIHLSKPPEHTRMPLGLTYQDKITFHCAIHDQDTIVQNS